jgi:hypothetical protein
MAIELKSRAGAASPQSLIPAAAEPQVPETVVPSPTIAQDPPVPPQESEASKIHTLLTSLVERLADVSAAALRNPPQPSKTVEAIINRDSEGRMSSVTLRHVAIEDSQWPQ